MPKTNEERLQEIAEGLQELNDRIVYVGGAMAGLYATDPVAVEPRTTLDVDCVVNSNNYAEHIAFEELLRAKNFRNDQALDAPVCRWEFNGEKVDVMSAVHGFMDLINFYDWLVAYSLFSFKRRMPSSST